MIGSPHSSVDAQAPTRARADSAMAAMKMRMSKILLSEMDSECAFCGYGVGMDFTARSRDSAKVSILVVCGLMLLSACGNSGANESPGETSVAQPTYAVF